MRILKFISISIVTFASLTACMQTKKNAYVPFKYIKSVDAGFQQVGDWALICTGGVPNDVGRSRPKQCRMEKYNFLSVVNISAQGESVRTTGGSDPTCSTSARHAAVDQVPIDDLSTQEQITLLKAGLDFARETQSAWPTCYVSIEKTSLQSFSQAYDALKLRWEKFRD